MDTFRLWTELLVYYEFASAFSTTPLTSYLRDRVVIAIMWSSASVIIWAGLLHNVVHLLWLITSDDAIRSLCELASHTGECCLVTVFQQIAP